MIIYVLTILFFVFSVKSDTHWMEIFGSPSCESEITVRKELQLPTDCFDTPCYMFKPGLYTQTKCEIDVKINEPLCEIYLFASSDDECILEPVGNMYVPRTSCTYMTKLEKYCKWNNNCGNPHLLEYVCYPDEKCSSGDAEVLESYMKGNCNSSSTFGNYNVVFSYCPANIFWYACTYFYEHDAKKLLNNQFGDNWESDLVEGFSKGLVENYAKPFVIDIFPHFDQTIDNIINDVDTSPIRDSLDHISSQFAKKFGVSQGFLMDALSNYTKTYLVNVLGSEKIFETLQMNEGFDSFLSSLFIGNWNGENGQISQIVGGIISMVTIIGIVGAVILILASFVVIMMCFMLFKEGSPFKERVKPEGGGKNDLDQIELSETSTTNQLLKSILESQNQLLDEMRNFNIKSKKKKKKKKQKKEEKSEIDDTIVDTIVEKLEDIMIVEQKKEEKSEIDDTRVEKPEDIMIVEQKKEEKSEIDDTRVEKPEDIMIVEQKKEEKSEIDDTRVEKPEDIMIVEQKKEEKSEIDDTRVEKPEDIMIVEQKKEEKSEIDDTRVEKSEDIMIVEQIPEE